jgi:transposase
LTNKKKRIAHSPEFKTAPLKLAEKVGVAAAARQLSLHKSQIYGWRKSANKKSSTAEREKELAAEVAKLKRQLAEQAEELEIVKNVWSAPFLQVKKHCQNTFASMYPACL